MHIFFIFKGFLSIAIYEVMIKQIVLIGKDQSYRVPPLMSGILNLESASLNRQRPTALLLSVMKLVQISFFGL